MAETLIEIRGVSKIYDLGHQKVYALRDDLGVVRMGLFTSQPGITLVRSGKGARWRAAVESESGLWSLLLGANYVTSAPDPVAEDSGTGLAELRALASRRIRAADRDPREVMDEIVELNDLDSSVLVAGQLLEVPAA